METEVTHLPSVMRAKGWVKGAALMERWFAAPETIAPAYGPPDTTTIKMDWVLDYPRAHKSYQEAVDGEVWFTPPARNALVKMLRRDKLFQHERRSFDYIKGDGLLSHPNHIQTHRFEQKVLGAPLDDLTAALATFAYHFVVAGHVEPVAPKKKQTAETCRTSDFKLVAQYHVRVERVGIYIRDNFDFAGHDPLGVWNVEDNFVGSSLWDVPKGRIITNGTFRTWRAENTMGGDFLVFSDVKLIERSPPDEFLYPQRYRGRRPTQKAKAPCPKPTS